MSRLDWKRGRFDVDYDVTEQQYALRGRADEVGQEVQWYRFDPAASVMDDLFDEGTDGGRAYLGPIRVPMLHVTHIVGANLDVEATGFYTQDELAATASFQQMAQILGLTDNAEDNRVFLRDRIVYDDLVFRVMQVEILGQVKNRDVIASIHASQIKRDELVNDVQFARWAR